MSIETLQPTYDYKEEQINKLKQLFPDVIKDGKVNFTALKEALGEIDDEDDSEHYGLQWPGKKRAKKIAFTNVEKTLEPVIGEGINEDTTENIFIEGDNLDVLKVLQKSYRGMIKMIYIDPPYNTGNDFVYKDDFKTSVADYLEETGQTDETGTRLVSNQKSSGRFHSNWLNMMYPRLKIAKELLRDNGVIYISIDDNEITNLRELCNEVFGEQNFVSEFIWEKKYTTSNNISGVSDVHEYILCYVKDIEYLKEAIYRLPYTVEARARYTNPDDDPRGDWMDVSYHGPKSPSERPNLYYPIIHPKTGAEIFPTEKSWAYEKSSHVLHVEENRLWWGKNFTYAEPRLKKFLSEIEGGLVPKSLLTYKSVGGTSTGRSDLRDLFGDKQGALFDNPKPVSLIEYLLPMATKDKDIVMDFFAGSGTTAHAVMKYNTENKTARKFILVQLPELLDENSEAYKLGYKNIAEICRTRIKKSSTKLRNALNYNGDLGFRAYRLTDSNFRAWETVKSTSAKDLFAAMENQIVPLHENWTKVGLLTEVILQEGFPLDSKVQTNKQFTGNTVSLITSEARKQRLFVCLDDKLSSKTIESLVLEDTDIFVCLDSGISTQDKTKLKDLGVVKTI